MKLWLRIKTGRLWDEEGHSNNMREEEKVENIYRNPSDFLGKTSLKLSWTSTNMSRATFPSYDGEPANAWKKTSWGSVNQWSLRLKAPQTPGGLEKRFCARHWRSGYASYKNFSVRFSCKIFRNIFMRNVNSHSLCGHGDMMKLFFRPKRPSILLLKRTIKDDRKPNDATLPKALVFWTPFWM